MVIHARRWLMACIIILAARAWCGPRIAGDTEWSAPVLNHDDVVTHEFAIRNTGDATLKLRDTSPPSSPITTKLAQDEVEPGQETTLTVELHGRRLPDEYTHTILIQTNDPEHPLWTVKITGGARRPSMVTEDLEWNLGDVTPGSKHSKTFVIKSAGTEPLVIENVKSDDSSVTASIELGPLPPGESRPLRIDWTAPDIEDPFYASVTIYTNDPLHSETDFTISARVSEMFGKPEPLKDLPEYTPELHIRFFHTPGCSICERIRRTVLPATRQRFGDRIVIEELSLGDEKNYALMMHLKELYGRTEKEPAYAFLGDRALIGEKEIRDGLDLAIYELLKHPVEAPDANEPEPDEETSDTEAAQGRASTAIGEHFASFRPLVVAGAGLLDGVNPCAFATIVFFISFLTYLGRGRREILLVGAIFTTVVFATYLLIGVGIYSGLKQLASLKSWLAPVITWMAIVLLLVLSGYHIADAIRVGATGRTREMTLQLPDQIKRRIHEIIRTKMSTAGLATGVAVTGFLVTLLESVCTGQTYIPTIVFVLRDPNQRAAAIGYLLLYNLMFIAPLILVFALSYFGVTSKRLAAWGQRNVIPVKVALAVVFLLMAFLLGKTVV